MNFQTATPAEIDTELAAIMGRVQDAQADVARQIRWIEQAEKSLGERSIGYYADQARERLNKLNADLPGLIETVKAIKAEADPHNAEFDRRGGWTRFFLVKNNNGHVHNSMSCTTCYADTDFAWLPEFSGQDEAGVVELAGKSACTVCFPSAPVDVLRRKSRIELPERKAARLEREAKAAAAAAKKAKNAIPETLVYTQGDRFPEKLTTLTSAKGRLTDHIQYVELFGWSEFITGGMDDLVSAIATKEDKTAEQVMAEARKRATKR